MAAVTVGGGGSPESTLGWSLAAWILVPVGLLLIGGRSPEFAYGTLILILLYLLLTHGGDVAGLVSQLLAGFAAPLEA